MPGRRGEIIQARQVALETDWTWLDGPRKFEPAEQYWTSGAGIGAEIIDQSRRSSSFSVVAKLKILSLSKERLTDIMGS